MEVFTSVKPCAKHVCLCLVAVSRCGLIRIQEVASGFSVMLKVTPVNIGWCIFGFLVKSIYCMRSSKKC